MNSKPISPKRLSKKKESFNISKSQSKDKEKINIFQISKEKEKRFTYQNRRLDDKYYYYFYNNINTKRNDEPMKIISNKKGIMLAGFPSFYHSKRNNVSNDNIQLIRNQSFEMKRILQYDDI